MNWAKLISTFFFVGNMRSMPGTWGSLVTLPIVYCMVGSPLSLSIFTIFCFIVGLKSTDVYIKQKQECDPNLSLDPKEVVIDEVVGQSLTFVPVAIIMPDYSSSLVTMLLGLMFFRIFDILKPFPVSYFDNKEGALYVMLDDVVAGVLASISVVLLLTFLIYISFFIYYLLARISYRHGVIRLAWAQN